jgi:hypothetical protein
LTPSQIVQAAQTHLSNTYINQRLSLAERGMLRPTIGSQINVGGDKGHARPIDRSEAAKRGWATRRKKQGS